MSTFKMLELAQAALETQLGRKDSFTITDPRRLNVPLQVLPERYSLRQLYSHLTDSNDDESLYGILILNSCLQLPERIVREHTDLEYAQNLLSWLSRHTTPTAGPLTYDDLSKDNKDTKSHITLEHLQVRSKIVFDTMKYLDIQFIAKGIRIDPDVLLSWIAYTNVEDPWTTKSLQKEVEELLNSHQEQSLASDFLIEYVLMGFIRPLFSNFRSPAITLQGRKAINASSISLQQQRDIDISTNTWKYHEIHALAIFGWTIKHMDETMVYKSWHLCIPPLLTLLDDASSSIRTRGLQVLIEILGKISPKVLQQTGLGEVFEDAVFPTLLFLPNVTPLKESLRVLEPAYLALFRLGEARFPTKGDQPNRMKFLDRIMREGIFQALLHSGENVAIVEFLLPQTSTLIERMGIHAVKHLKDLIPILSSILIDPFGLSHPGLLMGAARLAQTVILNCWPRMTESIYRVELIKSLSLCWTGIANDSSMTDEPRTVELEAVKEELRITFTVLAKSLEGRHDMMKELEPLVKVSPGLKVLFGLSEATYIAVG